MKETILTVEYNDLINMAAANNVTPYKSGNGIQCSFCLPNGKTWLIIWCETLPANITIHDTIGDTAVIIHDQISAQ